jgi:hypothetical protein
VRSAHPDIESTRGDIAPDETEVLHPFLSAGSAPEQAEVIYFDSGEPLLRPGFVPDPEQSPEFSPGGKCGISFEEKLIESSLPAGTPRIVRNGFGLIDDFPVSIPDRAGKMIFSVVVMIGYFAESIG